MAMKQNSDDMTSFLELVEKISKVIRYKDGIQVGDIILIIKPTIYFYGLVKEIKQDFKKGWWVISFTSITVPPQDFMWQLKEEYMIGEVFTMGGVPTFLKSVDFNGQPIPKVEENKQAKKNHLTLIK